MLGRQGVRGVRVGETGMMLREDVVEALNIMKCGRVSRVDTSLESL